MVVLYFLIKYMQPWWVEGNFFSKTFKNKNTITVAIKNSMDISQSECDIKSCGRYYVIQQQQQQKDFVINFQ